MPYSHKTAISFYNNTKDCTCPWPPPDGSRSFQRPAGVYETMLKKVAPYSLKGVLWYQGESDEGWPEIYYELMTLMINHWREIFKDDELYFFIVQLTTFGGIYPMEENWAVIRDAQHRVAKDVKYTGIANIMDVGDRDNIHPFDKKTVGYRLGLLAGHYLYSSPDNPFGPEITSINKTENTYKIVLKNTSGGLFARNGVVKGFVIEYIDGDKMDVEGTIVGDHIEISSSTDKDVKSISYGYRNFIETTVYNTDELPMMPMAPLDI